MGLLDPVCMIYSTDNFGIMNFSKDSFLVYLLLVMIPLGVVGETLSILIVLCSYRWHNVIPAFTIGLLLLTHYLLTGLWYDYPVSKTLQQISLIMLYFIAYSTFFKWGVHGFGGIWEKYLKVCFFFALIAWLQLFVYWGTGIDFLLWPGRNFTGDGMILRVHAYFEEPAMYAAFLTPYVVYFLMEMDQLKQSRLKFAIVFISYLLTFSSIGLVCLFIIVMYKLYHSRYKVLLLFLIALPILFFGAKMLESNNTFSETDQSRSEQSIAKISETITAFSNLSPGEFELLNASTYAIVSNAWVAMNAPNRMFGNGIGSHNHSYETLYTSDYILYGLNKADAFSLLTRIFSEFGVFGLAILLIFILTYANRQSSVNIASLFFFISCLIRGGHYTINGFFLFLFLFVKTSNIFKYNH